MTAAGDGEQDLLSAIDRAEAHFQAREPEVLAFLPEDGRFDRVRREARALLDRYPDAGARSALFGVLLGVKDVFRVDGFPTRAGSKLPAALFAGPEAESVRLLKRAGAIILGKTVSTEFAYFAPGPTRNPRDPAYTPGGSSSGSAAAVGAGLCRLALGTQTIGSITRPAAFCGVVGYKPSHERISRDGVIPLSPSLDHVGAFSPDVAGVQAAAGVLCADWRTAAVGRNPVLGIPDGPYLAYAAEEGRANFEQARLRLAARGFEIKTTPVMPDFEAIRRRHDLLVAGEAARVHAGWFAVYAPQYHPKTADLIRRGQAVLDAELNRARDGRRQLRGELTAVMDEHAIDIWISPAAPGAAPRGLDSTGDPVMNLPWTHSGLPTLCLPSGANADGLPMGLQLAGRWQGDERLLAWGSLVEKALRD